MRRRAVIILTCLLLGALTSIGVAQWAAFKSIDPATGSAWAAAHGVRLTQSNESRTIERWPGPVPASWNANPGRVSARLASHRWRDYESLCAKARPGYASFYVVERFGFPWRSLRRDITLEVPDDIHGTYMHAVAPVESFSRGVSRQADSLAAQVFDVGESIPIIPCWGLIANAVVYGSLFGLLFLATARVARRWRAKPGECPRCRYPIVGLAVCPECGMSAPSSERAI